MIDRKFSETRKIVLACIILILIFAAFKVFSILVWQVGIAERELSKYAKEMLGQDVAIECEYDWYNDRYIVTNGLGFVLDYRRQNKTIHDEVFSQMESEKVSRDYKALLANMSDNLLFPEHITVWTEVSVNDYELKSQRLYLLGVYNDETIPEEESRLMPAKIAMDVISGLGKDSNFTGIQAIYFDKNGMFEISFPADSFEAISKEKLIDNTKLKPAKEYPETYINWLQEKNT